MPNYAGKRIVCWFSSGAASAAATKLALKKYPESEIVIARCLVPEEHEDNDRFAKDCESWFGRPVVNLKSEEYGSCQEVWEKRRYMSGVAGAPCTTEMKKAVRWQFETDWMPDYQVFGYTSEEFHRLERFRKGNPEVNILAPLIDEGLDKSDCLALVARAGIEIPYVYRIGFKNANCIGCVKSSSPSYWNRVRRNFPAVFEARANLSREINCRLVTVKGARIFLDELNANEGEGEDREPTIECGILCAMAEMDLN